MRTIGIRELKAHLSSVLRDIQRGEHVLVTDRGRVIAEIRQPGAPESSASPRERGWARLASEGYLRVAESPVSIYQRSPVKSRPGLAREMLDAERGER